MMVVLGACSKAEQREPAPPAPAQPVPSPGTTGTTAASEGPSDQLLDNLALLAIGRPLDPVARKAAGEALRSKTTTMKQYLAELVRDPDFARVMVPRVVLGEVNFPPLSYYGMHPLKSTVVDGTAVHHYRKPCALAETTEVEPWWAPGTKIRICVGDYQPKGFVAKTGHHCSGTMVTDAPECGCGLKLINCVRDGKHNAELLESLYQETPRTIAHIVESDAPFKEVFTTKSSFRDRNTEYMKAREKLYLGKIKDIPDLSSWPAEGKWAPREELWPGAQAGILTTIQYLYLSDGPRDRMRLINARTWCSTPGSFGVTSAQFKDLMANHADIRSAAEGWRELAAAPGCTDCHARMDYAMQYLMAYPPIGKSVTPILADSRHKERGPIYVRDIDDPRGDGQLTARSLGNLIVAQPEFEQCMVTRVKEHVLGSHATPADNELLLKTFKETGRMQPLYVAALTLFAERAVLPAAARPTPAPTFSSVAASMPDQITLPIRLATDIQKHCGDCHEDGDNAFFADITTKLTLPRELLLTSANLVASELMPKENLLLKTDKMAILVQIIEVMAPDATWAKNASGYWLDQFWGSPTHHMSAVKERIAREASYTLKPEDHRRTVEDVLEGELQTFTPSFMTGVSQIALKACRPLAADATRYRACLHTATRPDGFLIR